MAATDRKSTRLNSSHVALSRMPSFCLMIGQPPTSPLFPYRPLFRSGAAALLDGLHARPVAGGRYLRCGIDGRHRSEEHTSELQSRGLISYAVFLFNDRATPDISPLPLQAALPIWCAPPPRWSARPPRSWRPVPSVRHRWPP